MNVKDIKREGIINLSVEYDGSLRDFRVAILDTVDGAFLLSPVVIDDQVVGFGEECGLRLLYIEEGKVYTWDVQELQVVKASLYGTCYKVVISGDATEVNRREAYRVFIGEYMDIMYLREQDHIPVRLSVLIRDISETGFCFITKEDYEVGKIVKLRIPTEKELFAPSAQITRKRELEDSIGVFQYGCNFKEENLKLSMYLLRVQREKQKQKLGGSLRPLPTQQAGSEPQQKEEKGASQKKEGKDASKQKKEGKGSSHQKKAGKGLLWRKAGKGAPQTEADGKTSEAEEALLQSGKAKEKKRQEEERRQRQEEAKKRRQAEVKLEPIEDEKGKKKRRKHKKRKPEKTKKNKTETNQ